MYLCFQIIYLQNVEESWNLFSSNNFWRIDEDISPFPVPTFTNPKANAENATTIAESL